MCQSLLWPLASEKLQESNEVYFHGKNTNSTNKQKHTRNITLFNVVQLVKDIRKLFPLAFFCFWSGNFFLIAPFHQENISVKCIPP